ncbi:MAG: S16 family serine protease [Candidatus Aenigmatarchaeota archaeon]
MKGLTDSFFTVVVVFILAFGMGFFANDYLHSEFKENISEKIVLTTMDNDNISVSRYAEIKVVAVTENGDGIIGRANIELVSGKGRVLINTNPFIEADAQQSAELAVSYAINYTNIELRDHDIIVSFNMSNGLNVSSRGQIIGGPSAGAALTVAIMAVLQGKKIRNDVAITGTVESDGYVGKVGGVLEKADAAGRAGLKMFLVPEGQEELTYYEKDVTEEKKGFFQIKKVRYVSKSLSLGNYTETEWNMSTYEIVKVEDALAYVIE